MANKQAQSIFTKAVIHYPDEKMMKQISKEMASFRCAAAIRLMDSLRFDDEQKAALIDSVLADIKPEILTDAAIA